MTLANDCLACHRSAAQPRSLFGVFLSFARRAETRWRRELLFQTLRLELDSRSLADIGIETVPGPLDHKSPKAE